MVRRCLYSDGVKKKHYSTEIKGKRKRVLTFFMYNGPDRRKILKISFYQQTVAETGKKQTESKVMRGSNRREEQGVSGGSYYTAGQGWDGMPGKTAEKGKSLIELQQEAANVDVGITQDYMTVMSNTMSEEDYAKMQEEGFDFGGMNPEEAVTIVDKIKAELVRSGKNIAGYTDDLDMSTLAAALGSQVLAEAVAQSFAQADLPLTEENLELVSRAWNMAEQLQTPDEGSIRYLIDNELDSEIWNLYLAENSGAAGGVKNAPRYYAEDVQGYFTRNGQDIQSDELSEQIDDIIRQSGRSVCEESRQDARWLLDNGLPLTNENLERLEELKGLELPVSPRRFSEAAAETIAEGKNPVHASLSGDTENIYEKAQRLEEYYQSDEVWEANAENLTARRQLEEIRLRMTAEVNIKLLKSGFSIDTAPMEKLVEALRQAESELAQKYFPGDEMAVEKYQSLHKTESVIAELPGLPAQVLGVFAEGQSTQTLEEFHREGKALQNTYAKAEESYEPLMTAPRRDLGDSIRKAFANVDDILKDMGQELTEENRRAVRILGYNRMEISAENLDKVREADRQVQTVVEKLTPAATLKMIRDGINPLEKSFSELEQYFESLPEEYQAEAESYSRFLYRLEKNHEITPEERESYIGIYRLVRQIEKADGAAIGALVNTQAELHFSNLLSAVRSGKFKTLDARVGDTLGTVAELVRKGESISEQIGKAFAAGAEKLLTEVSYSSETAGAYEREQLEQYRTAVASADREITSLLQRGEVSAAADNLLAAQALLEGEDNLFGIKKDVKRGSELWEKLDRPEDFEKEYEESVAETLDRVEEATISEADTSLDVRRMQLTHKQLTIAGTLAKKQEFFLPVYIGDKLTRVHLTLDREEGGGGTVDISVKSGAGQGLHATFGFDNGALHGILRNDNRNEVMKTEKIADIFKKEAGESWRLGDISVATTDIRFTAAGRGTDAGTENIELYRVAKSFLHAVQQGEMTDEN